MPTFELKGPLQRKIAKSMLKHKQFKKEVQIRGVGSVIIEQIPLDSSENKGDFIYEGINFRVVTKGLVIN